MAVDCATCGANSFESLNGFKYCTRCQRQSQDTSDMVVNCSYFRGETREIMNSDNYNTLSNPPWTSFEAFNKVLVDHVRTLQKNCPNELPKNFKSIVISVWMSYLEKCVMAFGDLLTHRKVMAILYISLRLAKTNIYASDLSRWVVARDMTYVNSTCILPINWNFYYHDYWLLNCQAPPSSVGIIKSAGEIAEFIEVDLDAKPDLVALMRRYLVDMNLPLDIVRFVTSNDKFSNSLAEYADRPLSQCARYEVHVLTLILVALKRLFVLDGYTEKVISDAIEAVDHDEVLFDFDAWENWTLFRVQLLEGYHFPLRDQSALRIKDVRILSRFSKVRPV
ncbi:TATA box-binding protein-associated factor RNA polymerase I subunit B [Halotydeus destructor]|nr:TATA box-binding protein-associated factor RNA polymerase I subunit B [Halotydeus destructor]